MANVTQEPLANMGELSGLMRRAHELWVEDGKPRPGGATFHDPALAPPHAEEIR